MKYLAVLCLILISTMSCVMAGEGNKKCRPQVRENNCPCTSKTAGLLNLDDGKLLLCDGNEWKGLQFEEPIGSRKYPGYSCKDILDNDVEAADGVYWITLTESVKAFPVYCDMVGGGWTMVFKAVTGANQIAYEAFKSDVTIAENEMSALDVTNQYPNDYKNRIVLNWGKFGQSEARVDLYKGGSRVVKLKFDAQGSDKENWFQFSKLTEHPWNDLATEPRNIFAIQEAYQRSFFINRSYGGCPNDAGWMVITGEPCDWEKHFGQNSVIYSKLPGYTNWNQYGNIEVADVLAVFVR